MRIGIRNTAFSFQIIAGSRFADWDMKEICDLRVNHYKLADLRTFTPQKFSDLRLRNEPKNFRGLYSVRVQY
jgi:hypothetical protein